MAHYVALIEHAPGTLHGVSFPDVRGCFSAGEMLQDAVEKSVEALTLWAEDALSDGEALPESRTFDELRADPEVAAALAEGAVLALVPLVVDRGRMVQVDVKVDAGLLDAVDQATRNRGLSRSDFLVSAVREKSAG